jgi:hypothetical protein
MELLADKPIVKKEDDALGRTDGANRLASKILSYSSSDPFVNLVKESIS